MTMAYDIEEADLGHRLARFDSERGAALGSDGFRQVDDRQIGVVHFRTPVSHLRFVEN